MSTELFDLTGQVAVVIGGARDLGRDMAESLADAGCHLAITSRQEASAQATAEHLKKTYGCEVYSAALDICDHAALSQFAQDVRQWQGRVDVVVNNAGGGLGLTTTDLFERKPEDARLLIDTNLTGPCSPAKSSAASWPTKARGLLSISPPSPVWWAATAACTSAAACDRNRWTTPQPKPASSV